MWLKRNTHLITLATTTTAVLTTISYHKQQPSSANVDISSSNNNNTSSRRNSSITTANDSNNKRPTMRIRRADTRLTPIDSIIVGYEDRLRENSSLEKVFKYFSSIVVGGREYMTPLDFVRAITPGVPPSPTTKPINIPIFESSLTQLREELTEIEVPQFFRFFGSTADMGLISYGRFIVFTVLLAIPSEQIDVLFHMSTGPNFRRVELRSEGLTAKNFDYILTHSIKARNQGYDPSKHSKTSILRHLFGENMDKILTLQDFKQFHSQLKHEVLKLEYYLLSDTPQGMSLRGFAQSVAALAPADYRSALSKRANSLPIFNHHSNNNNNEKIMGEENDEDYLIRPKYSANEIISLEDFENWKEVLKQLEPMEYAVKLFSHRDGHFSKTNILRAAKAVAGVDLNKAIVYALFYLFDPDNTEQLSSAQFTRLLKPHGVTAPYRSVNAGGLNLHLLFSCCTSACRECFNGWYDGTLDEEEEEEEEEDDSAQSSSPAATHSSKSNEEVINNKEFDGDDDG
jgi:hypothetical protein